MDGGPHGLPGSGPTQPLNARSDAPNGRPNALRRLLFENGAVILLQEFEIKTGGRLDMVDVTDDILALVRESGVAHGSVLVFSPHTTCCVMLEHPNNGIVGRLERLMELVAPKDGYYAHDDLDIRTENLVEDEPANAPAHIFNVLAGRTSEAIPVREGGLVLGDDQRVLFVELDCSRKRRYCIQVIGE
jgi:secondary thiamine-phosphate synthase enzyme